MTGVAQPCVIALSAVLVVLGAMGLPAVGREPKPAPAVAAPGAGHGLGYVKIWTQGRAPLQPVSACSDGDPVPPAAEPPPNPTGAQAESRRAIQLARQGDFEEAIAILDALRAAAPDDIDLTEDYVVVLNWAGRDADAVTVFSGLYRELTRDYVIEAAARSYRNLGRHVEALELYAFGRERSPDHLPFSVGLVATLVESGNGAAAVELGSRLAQEHPDNVDVLLAHGAALEAAQDFPAAIALYERLRAAEPGRRDVEQRWRAAQERQLPAPGAEHQQAIESARQGRVGPAISILTRAHRAQPDNLRVTYDYLVVLNWARRDAAVVDIFRGLDRDRTPDYVIDAAAKSYRNLRRFDQAIELYSYGRTRSPDHLPFSTGLILAALDAGRIEDAANLARETEQAHPGNVEVLLALAAALRAQRQFAEEVEVCDRVLALEPARSDVRRLRRTAAGRARLQPRGDSAQIPNLN